MKNTQNKASLENRFLGSLLDTFIFVIPLSFLIFFFIDSTLGMVSAFIIAAIDGAVFYPKCGGNFGHFLLGMQVVDEQGNTQNNAIEGIKRECLKTLFFTFCFLPNLWILVDPNKQNLYDKILNTNVIKK